MHISSLKLQHPHTHTHYYLQPHKFIYAAAQSIFIDYLLRVIYYTQQCHTYTHTHITYIINFLIQRCDSRRTAEIFFLSCARVCVLFAGHNNSVNTPNVFYICIFVCFFLNIRFTHTT